MKQRRSAEDLQDDSDEDVLILSDELRQKLGHDEAARYEHGPAVSCTVYYEIPSAGISGHLLRYRKSKGSIRLGIEIPPESIQDALSCPEFIRSVVTIGDKVVAEADFNDPWVEEYRELISKDGRVELHISLVEHDT